MATNVYNSTHMQTVDYTNGGSAISSGDIVVVGGTNDAFLAVALVDIANGETGSVGYNCGVKVAKVSGAVWGQGESLMWDSSASAFDDNAATAAAGDVKGAAARAETAGTSGTTTANIWLTGIPATLS